MNKNKRNKLNRDFQELAIQVNNAIIKNDGLIGDQKAQVEKLFELEQKIKAAMHSSSQIGNIYGQFIKFIKEESGNILNAGPYFREKAEVFRKHIFKAIREEDVSTLMQFNINYQFIDFVLSKWRGAVPKKIKLYYKEFLDTRRILIENNLPLAINRAKLFYRKTPRSHLSLLDLIDICTYGLIVGIDKYVGEYNKVWRGVCIGRMVGFMIEEYSKTFIRMYPSDKKILYRANALRFRNKIEDMKELAMAVNRSFEEDKKEGKKVPKLPIAEVHISTLINSSSYVTAEGNKNSEDESEGGSIYDQTPVSTRTAEEDCVEIDLINKIYEASKNLDLMEKKIIRLKGVDI